jgi:peptide/nickel transport system ATP-binding protein
VTRILEISNLSTHIQLSRSVVQAVGNVDLHIEAGETLGLVGESGCGKSMTGLSIMGLLPPGGKVVSGSMKLEGRELVGMPDAEMRKIRGNEIAMIFQDSASSLNPTKSIGDQVAEPVLLHRDVTRKEAYDRAAEVLGLVGLPRPTERLKDFPHQLSGGLRQRVMIAMALACDPKVLIADEPTTALDVTIQAQILRVLDDLKERLGMAILLVTHDMGVVAGRADRVNVMYAGRMVEATDTQGLFDGMRHPYTQALLASIPRMDQDNTKALFSIPGLPPDLTNPPVGCRFRPRCSYAQADCAVNEPDLAGEDGHQASCWHPVAGPLVLDKTIVVHEDGSPTNPGREDRPLLEVLDLVKEFPVTSGSIVQRKVGAVKAVSGVSLTVGVGEIFGLVGESGCGKTTLGRMIVGLEKPDSGKVLLRDDDIFAHRGRDLRKRRRDLQMMFQDPFGSLDPRMRVGAILTEPLAVQHVGTRKEQTARAAELLDEVGLPRAAMERFPHEFSGGQRQRIGLARALTLNPQVIVADEPVSALDVSIRSQVLNLMKRLQAERDMAYVVISHDLAVVKYLADRIGVMYLGKLVELAPGAEIYARPAHPYTDGLIKTIPLPDPRGERAKTDVGIRGELPSPVNPPSGCRFRSRCPKAQDLCAEQEPPLRSFGPGHVAACHFPLIDPVSDDVPVTVIPVVESSEASFD